MKSAIELLCRNWDGESSSINGLEEEPETFKGVNLRGFENPSFECESLRELRTGRKVTGEDGSVVELEGNEDVEEILEVYPSV